MPSSKYPAQTCPVLVASRCAIRRRAHAPRRPARPRHKAPRCGSGPRAAAGTGPRPPGTCPGHRLNGDMRQRQIRDPRDRYQSRGVHGDARCHRPGRARVGERRHCRRDSRRGHGLQAFRSRPHRHCFAGRPDRRAGQDVTVSPVEDAMTADLQDGKAHHLLAPRPVPGAAALVASRSCQLPPGPVVRQGSYDQDSAICAIVSKRPETPSRASCRNSPVLIRMLPPHTSVSTRRASGGAV